MHTPPRGKHLAPQAMPASVRCLYLLEDHTLIVKRHTSKFSVKPNQLYTRNSFHNVHIPPRAETYGQSVGP